MHESTSMPSTALWPSQLTSAHLRSHNSNLSTRLLESAQSRSIAYPSMLRQAQRNLRTPPRRTLTNEDRRNMCNYADEHPDAKQTEIGAVFSVDRSTVSKVLRNRSKYFGSSASGTDSPSRLGIEKQLLEWALDQDDPMLSDEMIQQQAAIIAKRMSSENSNPAHSSKWLRKFKRDVRMKLATRNSSVQSGGSASPEYLSEPALHEMSSWDSLRSKSSRNATIAAAGIFADTAGVNTMRDFTHIDPRLHNQSSYLSLGGASSTSMAPDAIMGATSSDLSRPIDMVRRHTVPGSNRPQPPPSTMDNFYDPNMHLYLPAPTDSPMQNYDYTTIKPHSLDTTIQPSSSYDAFGDYSLATMDGLNYHHQNSDVVPRSLPTPRHDHTVVGEEEATLATALENYKARAVARGALAEAIDAVLESLRPPPTDGLE